jgi:hypothetical protein
LTVAQLARDPQVVKLAKDLGLNWRGDCLAAIRAHALEQVDEIKRGSPISIGDLDVLRRIVADKLRMKLEFIHEKADLERIAEQHASFHPDLRQRLVAEFGEGDTEGITLERYEWDERFFRYLAVVDARGERASRAYFTAWHELAHLLVHPDQLPFPGFRRTPAATERDKDPIESVVDHIAGRVAFHPPLFAPALERAMADHGGLTFEALDAARFSAAPTASLFATAMGSIQVVSSPVLLVTAEMALKAEERRFTRGPQVTFDFAATTVKEKLRVTTVAPNDLVAGSSLAIRRNMRVPAASVLAQAHASEIDVTLGADEHQEWWESSRGGPLASQPIRVEAVRRGRYVYGIIKPLGAQRAHSSLSHSAAGSR